MQTDEDNDVTSPTTGVKPATDVIHNNSSTLLLTDDVDVEARDDGPYRVQKRQRKAHVTTDTGVPLNASAATEVSEKSNFLSTNTQKAKVKKRGFSIAHEFEREISVSTSVSIPLDLQPSSPIPSSTAPPSSLDLFSPKPPTPEKVAPAKANTTTARAHRRETISPDRVPLESESHAGPGRRDTLSPDGLQGIQNLVLDESSQESDRVDGMDDDEKDSLESNARSTSASERRARSSASYHDMKHAVSDELRSNSWDKSLTSPTNKSSLSASRPEDHVSRRSTLDPAEVAGIFTGRDSLLVPATGRRETLDPLEALAVLQGGTSFTHDPTTAVAPADKPPHEHNDVATKAAESAAATTRDTVNPADLMALPMDNHDSSDDENQVLGSFRVETTDGERRQGTHSAPQDAAINERNRLSVVTTSKPANLPSVAPPVAAARNHQGQVVTKPGPHPSLFSPPMRRNQPTPLKSCLSARKMAVPKKADDPTPTKSVVFGSPRGAEFRRNDPSTSMTPMCAQRTKEMFPLDKMDSDEDEVTSENTSILDEADHLMDKDESDDENQSLSFPFGSIRSPTRKRSRASNGGIKGLSPLDAMADARRQRRASIGVSGLPPPHLPSSALKPSRRQSLLGVNVMQSSDSLVIGSAKKKPRRATTSIESSSSDDMDITGDYSNVASGPPSSKATAPDLSNGLGDLWNDNYTPPKTAQLTVESSDDDEDQTLELGPVGHLQGDASLFAIKHTSMASTTTAVSATTHFVSEVQTSLHPIAEGEEGGSSRSSLLSHLSLSDDDDDDDGPDDPNYDAQRESLVINLGGKFDKMGSSGKKKKQNPSPRAPTSPSSMSLEEASSRPTSSIDAIDAVASSPTATAVDLSLGSPSLDPPQSPTKPATMPASPAEQIADVPAVPSSPLVTFAEFLAALSLDPVERTVQSEIVACSKLLVVTPVLQHKDRWTQAMDELSTWLSEMSVERDRAVTKAIPSYLAKLVQSNAVPQDEVLALYEAHLHSVLAGWYAWRKRMESPTHWSTALTAVEADLAALQRLRIGRDEAHERAAVQKLMAKELDMERSLEWIQEHQTLRAEAASRIAKLENELETLQLTLVQHDHDIALHRMKLDETSAAVSNQKLNERIHLVQEREDLYHIASRLSKWAPSTVSAAALELHLTIKSLNYMDGITVRVKIDLAQAGTTRDKPVDVNVAPIVARKQPSIFYDIAALVRVTLLDPSRLEAVGATTVSQPQGVSTFLQWAEVDVMRSMRLWNDVEQVVLQYAVATDLAARQIRIAFVSFQSLVTLRVGLPLTSHFYFSRSIQPTVTVELGAAKVDVDELVRRIEAVPRGFRRLHAICTAVTTYIESLV
ncbi:hypothetical protein H310_07437 [Aphanomyces invadans]|uniref:Spc7 kinetochore protein domain-containing protein n=1 Tax=Aphanomyces invadans TaxID=157072 RepID=A0A024U168_9STRA|nr:hypothetical protein H310_07437 [Aphanomyces invadans]ETV99988.1 hypothetical protein H310_07437 [Aphanomyces invadans]|eukprot:XP_008871406.1 hypothetical protein H310_07437 [Aphanomyces invadans]